MKLIVLLILLLTSMDNFAQNAHFIKSAIITYEKTINLYAIYRKNAETENRNDIAAYEDFKKNNPQFKRLVCSLNFNQEKTLFTPVDEEINFNGFIGNQAMIKQHNVVFTDLLNHTVTVQKQIFDETYLLKDSIRKINWKITDETRIIDGFTCHRANALVLDSIYVVAFYTGQIPVSAGPESFNGLPGMILEVALPHENITWLATNVQEEVMDNKQLAPPKKGKIVNNNQLQKIFQDAKKDWGVNAGTFLKAFQL